MPSNIFFNVVVRELKQLVYVLWFDAHVLRGFILGEACKQKEDGAALAERYSKERAENACKLFCLCACEFASKVHAFTIVFGAQ